MINFGTTVQKWNFNHYLNYKGLFAVLYQMLGWCIHSMQVTRAPVGSLYNCKFRWCCWRIIHAVAACNWCCTKFFVCENITGHQPTAAAGGKKWNESERRDVSENTPPEAQEISQGRGFRTQRPERLPKGNLKGQGGCVFQSYMIFVIFAPRTRLLNI